MIREKILHWVTFILGLIIIGFGLREFDYNQHYLTGLFLFVGGAYIITANELENRLNNESFK